MKIFESSKIIKLRSSLPDVFCKKAVLRNSAKLIGKHLCLRPATLLRDSGTDIFLWIFAKFLRTPFFNRTPPVAASKH